MLPFLKDVMAKHIIKSHLAVCIAATASLHCVTAVANDLIVPVMERSQGDLDTCALGSIIGLKEGGDGFLAVRSGPGTEYNKIGELNNGDRIWLFDQKGQWIGIIHHVDEVSCGPIKSDRIVPHEGRKGWVHENWVKVIAG